MWAPAGPAGPEARFGFGVIDFQNRLWRNETIACGRSREATRDLPCTGLATR